MLPSIEFNNAIQMSSEYQDRVFEFMSKLLEIAFANDVMGYQANYYNKALSVHHIGFVIFLMSFQMEQESAMNLPSSHYYEKYNISMLSEYLSCLGIRDNVLTGLISDMNIMGIGNMIIEQTFQIN